MLSTTSTGTVHQRYIPVRNVHRQPNHYLSDQDKHTSKKQRRVVIQVVSVQQLERAYHAQPPLVQPSPGYPRLSY